MAYPGVFKARKLQTINDVNQEMEGVSDFFSLPFKVQLGRDWE